MSELKNKGKVTTTYMVCGTDGKGLIVEEAKEQPAVGQIPGIPMEIVVDTHNCKIMPDGTIVREGRNGQNLGKVTDPKKCAAIKKVVGGKEQEQR